MAETFVDWEARLERWLASFPLNDPIHSLDDMEKCEAFSKWEETSKKQRKRK